MLHGLVCKIALPGGARWRWLWSAWLVFLTLPVTAGVAYRWTDADGQTHFGARPPPGVEARAIGLPGDAAPPADSPTADSGERRQRMLDSLGHAREQRRAEREAERRRRTARAADCETLRAQWRLLAHGGPLYRRADDGSREFLDEAQRVAERERLRPYYQAACGTAP